MPFNLSYFYNFGILLLVSFLLLLITGFLSVTFYSPGIDYSFDSVIASTSSKYLAAFLRIAHNYIANIYFLLLFFHIFKAFFHTFKSAASVLYLGAAIFVISCGNAFFGYSLPLGQMSFWAIIVIFNLLSVFPFGDTIIVYLFGGFAPTSRTIGLLFLLHFLLPFVILVLIAAHLACLHASLSSNALALSILDLVCFLDFYLIIDLFVVAGFFFILSILLFFHPFALFEAVNFNVLNTLSTPLHIIPDWFLLFPYVCLRSFHNKVIGIIVLLIIVVSFFYLNSIRFSVSYSYSYYFFNYFFIFIFILITWLGFYPPSNHFIFLVFFSLFCLFYFYLVFYFNL